MNKTLGSLIMVFILVLVISILSVLIFFFITGIKTQAITYPSYTNIILSNNNSISSLSKAPSSNFQATVKNMTWINFNGINQSIDMGNQSAYDIYQSPFTISFWIYPINITNNVLPRVLEKRTNFIATMGNESNARFSQLALEMQNLTGTNTVEFWSRSNLTLNKWENWAFVYNGSNGTWFRNGASDGVRDIYVGATDNWAGSLNTSTQNLFIGKRRTDDTRDFNGSLDEMRFYNVNLSSSDIAAINNSGRTKNTSLDSKTQLTLMLSFNENQGTIVYDTSQFNNNGSINNSIFQNDGINILLINQTNYITNDSVFIVNDANYAWTQIIASYIFNTDNPNIVNIESSALSPINYISLIFLVIVFGAILEIIVALIVIKVMQTINLNNSLT